MNMPQTLTWNANVNNLCKPMPQGCVTEDCLACTPGLFTFLFTFGATPAQNVHRCEATCIRHGTYSTTPGDFVCAPCTDPNCWNCDGLGAGKCIACKIGFFLHYVGISGMGDCVSTLPKTNSFSSGTSSPNGYTKQNW